LSGFVLSGHHRTVADEEAMTLMLEGFFDIRTMVSEVHAVVMAIVEDDNGEEEEEEDS
jgi:hypothetical protein